MPDFTDRATSFRKGENLDFKNLSRWLIENLPDAGDLVDVQQFPGGFSNLTYLLKFGDKEFVLRRPPFGAKIKSGHDMSREFRILSGLKDSFKKVPAPVIFCEDESVIGDNFYIMERVKGVILRATMPKEMNPPPDKMRSIAKALVDTFVELHNVDYKSAGLDQMGKPKGYVRRQVEGWTSRYLKSKTDEVESIELTAKWLSNNMPAQSGACIIHNDFKYDNLILDQNDWSNVVAVLDWEMATLGDPLMDLGSSLGYWTNENDPPFISAMKLSPTTIPGNPTRQEVIELYEKASGHSVGNPVFYYVYGLFKLSVIIQQIYARYAKGFTKDERFVNLNEVVKGCGMMAVQAIHKDRIDNLF